MANVTRGSTVHITRTEAQEPKIIDVSQWLAYRVVDSVVEVSPVLFLNNPVTVTLPVTEEGVSVYSFDAELLVGNDLVAGQKIAWRFVPTGTEADLVSLLTWQTVDYDVVNASSSLSSGCAIGVAVSPCF